MERSDDVRLLLLGDTRLFVCGVEQSTGGPRQRAVLALLALNANHTVSVDRLIDDLWDEHATLRQPRNNVQVYVSSLRRVLRPVRDSMWIIGEGSGYRLVALPGTIDYAEFRDLAATGRRQLEQGSTVAAATALHSALELLAVLWALGIFAGAPFGQAFGAAVAVLVLAMWIVIYLRGRRRTARVVAALPAVGRSRLLQPVRHAIRVCALVFAAGAALALAVLYPVTQQHAVDLGFARDEARTKTVVFQGESSNPSGATPADATATATTTVKTTTTAAPTSVTTTKVAPPARAGTIPTLRPLPTFAPVPTYRLPEIRTVVVPARDHPEEAWRLMAYDATAATATLLVAGLLLLQARSLPRD